MFLAESHFLIGSIRNNNNENANEQAMMVTKKALKQFIRGLKNVPSRTQTKQFPSFTPRFAVNDHRKRFQPLAKNESIKCVPEIPEHIKRLVLKQIPEDLLKDKAQEKKQEEKENGKRKKIVAVALSGGVDSFIALWLMKKSLCSSSAEVTTTTTTTMRGEKGANENDDHDGDDDVEIKAVLMKNWDELEETNKECSFEEDRRSARKLAKYLDVELIEVDFCREYWREVFEPFCEQLEKGTTPNPDVACNREIKFGKLLEYVKREIGAEYLCTGHYAKIIRRKEEDVFELHRANDEKKDQTYFLASVPSSALKDVIFPLAELEKSRDVMDLLMKETLGNVANVLGRKSSAGICFIGKKRNFADFVHEYVQPVPAKFIDVNFMYNTSSNDREGFRKKNSSRSSNGKNLISNSSSSSSSSSISYDDVENEKIMEDFILGECKSVHGVTVGQGAKIGGLSKPYFVVGKKMITNKVTTNDNDDGRGSIIDVVVADEKNKKVTSSSSSLSSKVYVCQGGDHPALFTTWCVIKDVHFIQERTTERMTIPRNVRVKTRYASPLVSATASDVECWKSLKEPSFFCSDAFEKETNNNDDAKKISNATDNNNNNNNNNKYLEINFSAPEKAVAIGQTVVIYDPESSKVLGCGTVCFHGLTLFEEKDGRY